MNGVNIWNKIFVGIIALIVLACLQSCTATKCAGCGKGIRSIEYRAYGKSYCSSCAYTYFPGATWR